MRNVPATNSNTQLDRTNVERTYTAQFHNKRDDIKENSLKDILRILRRRLWTVIIPLFIIVPIVIWGILYEKPIYETTATILIEEMSPQAVPNYGVLSQDLSRPTELELIKDRVLVERVVDFIQLDKNIPEEVKGNSNSFLDKIVNYVNSAIAPIKGVAIKFLKPMNENLAEDLNHQDVYKQQIIEKFQKSLKVAPREGTKLVDITLSGYDSHAITDQLNMLVDIYIKNNLSNRLGETKKAVEWLEKEAEKMKASVLVSESALQEYREKKKFVDFDTREKSTDMQNLSELNSSYISIKRDRVLLENQIKKLAEMSPDETEVEKISNITTVVNDKVIQDLKSEHIKLKSEYDSLLKKYQEKHPKMILINSNMETIKNSIVENMRSKYEELIANELGLKEELISQREDIIKYKSAAAGYDSLTRELEVNKNLYIDLLKKLRESSLAEAVETNNIKTIRWASVPIFPKVSGRLYKILTGIFVGLGVGMVFAFVAEYFDKRFKKVDEVESYLRIPFLGIIPQHGANKHKSYEPVLLQKPMSFESEAYRILRTRIQLSSPEPIKTLLVTSAIPTEGKSTTVANLGISFAQLGQKVLLVDVDLRRPSLHRHFKMPNNLGLTDILVRRADWKQIIRDTKIADLKVLTTGVRPYNPSELLNMERMRHLIEDVRNAFDMVVFDAPIVLSLPDVEILAPRMDGVLLVHHPEKGDRELASEAKKILERTGAQLLGLIFNNVNQKYYLPQWPYDYSGRSSRGVRNGAADAEIIEIIDMRPVGEEENRPGER